MSDAYNLPWVTNEIGDLHRNAVKFFQAEAAPQRRKWEKQNRVDRVFVECEPGTMAARS